MKDFGFKDAMFGTSSHGVSIKWEEGCKEQNLMGQKLMEQKLMEQNLMS
jgi:hypothetical protein